MPNLTQGPRKRHWGSKSLAEKRAAERERMAIRPEHIEFQTTLPNGALFTRLKPGVASGCETAELWKNWRL